MTKHLPGYLRASLSYLTSFRRVILSRRLLHKDAQHHPCQTRVTLQHLPNCSYGSIQRLTYILLYKFFFFRNISAALINTVYTRN